MYKRWLHIELSFRCNGKAVPRTGTRARDKKVDYHNAWCRRTVPLLSRTETGRDGAVILQSVFDCWDLSSEKYDGPRCGAEGPICKNSGEREKIVRLETAQEISSCRLCKRLPDGGIAFCSWPTCYMIRIDFERSP